MSTEVDAKFWHYKMTLPMSGGDLCYQHNDSISISKLSSIKDIQARQHQYWLTPDADKISTLKIARRFKGAGSEWQGERNFQIFAFFPQILSLFPPNYFPIFPDFWQIFPRP